MSNLKFDIGEWAFSVVVVVVIVSLISSDLFRREALDFQLF